MSWVVSHSKLLLSAATLGCRKLFSSTRYDFSQMFPVKDEEVALEDGRRAIRFLVRGPRDAYVRLKGVPEQTHYEVGSATTAGTTTKAKTLRAQIIVFCAIGVGLGLVRLHFFWVRGEVGKVRDSQCEGRGFGPILRGMFSVHPRPKSHCHRWRVAQRQSSPR